jgi:hypothetical protein
VCVCVYGGRGEIEKIEKFSFLLRKMPYLPSKESSQRVSDSSPRHSLQYNQTLKYFSPTDCSGLILYK